MIDSPKIKCPLCGDLVERLVFRFHHDSEQEVLHRIKEDHSDWVERTGACSRCLDYYHTEVIIHQRILPEAGPHFPVKSIDDFIILPTALRLDADPHYTGKGITICFIDSGFYLHDDLVKTRNRVKAVIDITNPNQGKNYFSQAHPESWHGTMTSVVCAGDGYLSNGLYKGIASEADLVLIKTQITDESHLKNGKITTENIAAALQWVLDHHREFAVRIVSISLSDDQPLANNDSVVSQLAEKLIAQGIIVVAAAGNDLNGQLKPPASSPNVITVGGLDDFNQLQSTKQGLYHSTYGQTLDGLMKPELVAPAIWVAAPILPDTREKHEAEWMHRLVKLKDDEMEAFISFNNAVLIQETELDFSSAHNFNWSSFRSQLTQQIQTTKFFSDAYMHVDGTSFAAPIVSSIIAQLLQCNPSLTPADLRTLLFKTAKRISHLEAARQGFGAIHPRKAIIQVLKRENIFSKPSPFINKEANVIEFYVQHDCAYQIALAGDFNSWARDVIYLWPGKNGVWKTEIPMLPQGTYRYKFFIDERNWQEDIGNPLREPDPYFGFNSLLKIGG
jgi:serine protease AprX